MFESHLSNEMGRRALSNNRFGISDSLGHVKVWRTANYLKAARREQRLLAGLSPSRRWWRPDSDYVATPDEAACDGKAPRLARNTRA